MKRIETSPERRINIRLLPTCLLALAVCSASRLSAQTPENAPSPAAPTAPASAQEPIEPPAPSAPASPPPEAAPPPPPPAPPPLPAAPPAPAAGPFAENVTHDQPNNEVTSLSVSGGAAIAAGNTKSYQVNTGADFQLIRYPHGVAAYANFAYGVADVPDASDELVNTMRNLNARARYDLFLSRMDAVFLATVYRWDPFAGIDCRNQGQIGYLRYVFRQSDHRLWGEVGYDLTSDNYGPAEGAADPVEPDPDHKLIHSARLFVGYENKINAALAYLGGLEGLLNVEDPGDSRINFSNAIQSAISDSFRLELKLTFAYDSEPVENAQKLDTTFVANLIYRLL